MCIDLLTHNPPCPLLMSTAIPPHACLTFSFCLKQSVQSTFLSGNNCFKGSLTFAQMLSPSAASGAILSAKTGAIYLGNISCNSFSSSSGVIDAIYLGSFFLYFLGPALRWAWTRLYRSPARLPCNVPSAPNPSSYTARRQISLRRTFALYYYYRDAS